MAEIVYLEINSDNIIIGAHSDPIDPEVLPEGNTLVKKTIEDPSSLLGLSDSLIDEPPSKRPKIDPITDNEKLRQELKSLSIELDLQTRLGEDTTVTQDLFDQKKLQYENLP